MDERLDTRIDDLWPMLEPSYDGVLLVQAESWRVLRANSTVAQWLEVPSAELVGRIALELFLDEFKDAVLQHFATALLSTPNQERCLAKLNPSERRKRLVVVKACRIVWDGDLALGVWLIAPNDSDYFIDVPNPLAMWRDRTTMERRIYDLLREYEVPKPFALMFIDLDNFKEVNDRHGHIWGDRILSTVAQGIGKCLGEGELAARYGGDEFLVLVREQTNAAYVDTLVDRIRTAIATPKLVPGEKILLTASVGVVWASPEFRTPDDIIAAADREMYAEKWRKQGRAGEGTAGEPAR